MVRHFQVKAPLYRRTNGLYDVSLNITTASGCEGSITLSEYISVEKLTPLTSLSIQPSIVLRPILILILLLPQLRAFLTLRKSIIFGILRMVPLLRLILHFNIPQTPAILMFYWLLITEVDDSLQIDSLIYINAPVSKFEPDEVLYCNPGSLPVEVDFTDEAVHGVTDDDILMIWEWGDGMPNDTLDDPELDDLDMGSFSHSFSEYGTYTIEQVIHNYTTGCSDSSTREVHISSVSPAFTLSYDSICSGDSLFMFDASTSWSDHQHHIH